MKKDNFKKYVSSKKGHLKSITSKICLVAFRKFYGIWRWPFFGMTHLQSGRFQRDLFIDVEVTFFRSGLFFEVTYFRSGWFQDDTFSKLSILEVLVSRGGHSGRAARSPIFGLRAPGSGSKSSGSGWETSGSVFRVSPILARFFLLTLIYVQ